MPVKVIFNNSSNAPQLSGQAGALIAMLDAFLIDGYVGHTPPGGWVKAFSGVNKAVYRSEFFGASGMYFRVDDSNALYAVVTGYEAMTGVDTGTNSFGTVYWRKSQAADATTRYYCLAADEKTVIFHPCWVSAVSYYGSVNLFGDFISHIPGDLYNAALIGDYAASATSVMQYNYCYQSATLTTTQSGHILARPYTFAPGGALFGKAVFGIASSGIGTAGYASQPDPGNGDYYSSPLMISEGTCYRGRLPGLHAPLHAAAENLYAAHSAVVDGVNRTFRALIFAMQPADDRMWLDATGPWQ